MLHDHVIIYNMIVRHIHNFIRQSMLDFPAVLLNGARQVGKSTLAHQLQKTGVIDRYVTLDDLTTLRVALVDPDGFLQQFQGPVAIDEIQRAPDLLRAVKKRIDEDRKPGQFLLTGSANVLSYPGVSESLAGRVDIIPLEGLSLGELYRQEKPSSLISDLFSGTSLYDLAHHWNKSLENKPALTQQDLSSFIYFGGFPDVALKRDIRFRDRWFSSYETAYIDKDVKDLSRFLDVVSFSKLFHLAGLQTGNLLNQRTLSVEMGLDQRTVARYFEILEMTFQVQTLTPWFSNIRKRLIKTPKIYANDSGQASYLMGIASPDHLMTHPGFGALLETWVWAEIRKLLSMTAGIERHFYRTHLGKEVDFLLNQGMNYWGIECKASTSVSLADCKGITDMIEAIGPQAKGMILYAGSEVIVFSDRIIAVPLRILI